jgi:DNA-nicking Smr family endonuclease
MSDAMKDFPYTCRVDIVTGGGNQILAETVEHWIQEKRHIAN